MTYINLDQLIYFNIQWFKLILEDITHLLNPNMRYRFNIRQDRLYIDADFGVLNVGDYFVIDCFRILDTK